MKKHFLTFVCLFLILFGNAQSDVDSMSRVGWFAGANAGAFWANDTSSTYYNGQQDFGIDWIFSIPQYYNQIYESLGQNDFTVGEYPDRVQNYRPGLNIGVNAGYMFTEKSGIFTDVNLVTIKTADIWLIAVDDPVNFEPILHQADIIGEEKRLHINLGYRHIAGENENGNLFFEVGGSFQNTKVEKNEIHINNLTYNLLRPVVPNTPNSIQITTGGSAAGVFVGSGLNYRMNPNFSFDFGLNLRLDKVIVDPELDNPYSLQTFLFARFIYH